MTPAWRVRSIGVSQSTWVFQASQHDVGATCRPKRDFCANGSAHMLPLAPHRAKSLPALGDGLPRFGDLVPAEHLGVFGFEEFVGGEECFDLTQPVLTDVGQGVH